jgi:DNA-binding SARP family transcriptional activator/Tfp pilus assembly protein PilF
MNAALCDELLGITHAQAELEAIEARRLFIAHLEGDWYRYHHLFREFLEARQQQTNPARFRELHCRAAKIFERRGNLNEAIGHWLQSEAFDQAARLIEKAAPPLYDQGRWTTLAQWMDALPSEVLLATPDLLLRRGKIFAETGDLNQALATLETARVEFERRAEVTNVARVLIEEAVVARLQGQTRECLDKCEAALARLDSNQFALNALAYRTMGTALGRQGDWGGAISHLERALGLYQLASGRYDTALVEHDLGVALYTIGKRESANAHFQAALVYWRELGSAADLANTLNSIGVSHYYQGELDQARVVLEQALQEARRVRYLRIEALVLAGLGDVYRDSGEYERALQAYTEAFHIAEKIHGGFLLTYTLSAMADTWRLNGDLNLADQVARSAVDEARARRSEYEVALTQTALGALRLEQGQFNEAMTSLSQALGLFERGQAKRDAARVHYFLALAHFRQKQYDETRRHLDALASIGKALGEDQFILAEGLRAKPVVQFAVSRRVANGYFQRVLEKMRKIAPAPRLAAQLIEPAWPHLEVFTLGPARVLLDGQPVEKGTWQTATTKELFFYFAVHPHGWRKDQITARLWPELSRAKANDLFHVNVWRIRRGLYPECLVYRNGVYELNPEAERWVDVGECERLLAEADRVVDEAQRATLLRRALDLYRGDFLEESYSDWCETRRAALVERYLSALMRLAEYHARLRDFARAIELYQAGLRKDNTREEIYRALMKLYIDMGDRASALHVYGRCVEILDEELEVAPMPETVALYKQIARKA